MKTRILHFSLAPWLKAYLHWLDATGTPTSLALMDAFQAGYEAAEAKPHRGKIAKEGK